MANGPKKLAKTTKQVLPNTLDIDQDHDHDIDDLIGSLEMSEDSLSKELQAYLQKRVNYIVGGGFSRNIGGQSYFDEAYNYLMKNASEETQSYIDTANNQELALLFVLMKRLGYMENLENIDVIQTGLSEGDNIHALSLSPTSKLIAAVLKFQKKSKYYTSTIDGLPGGNTVKALLCEIGIGDCVHDTEMPGTIDGDVLLEPTETSIDGTRVPPLLPAGLAGLMKVPGLWDGELKGMSDEMVKKEITRGTQRLEKNLSVGCEYCTYVSNTIEAWLWGGDGLDDANLADTYIDTVFSKSNNNLQRGYRLTKLTDKSLQEKYLLEYLYDSSDSSGNPLDDVSPSVLQHIVWNISKNRSFEEMYALGVKMVNTPHDAYTASAQEKVSFVGNEQLQRYHSIENTPIPYSFMEDKIEDLGITKGLNVFHKINGSYTKGSASRLESYVLQSTFGKAFDAQDHKKFGEKIKNLEELARGITKDKDGNLIESSDLVGRIPVLLQTEGAQLANSLEKHMEPMNKFLEKYVHEMPLYKEYGQKSIVDILGQDVANIPSPRPWEKVGISLSNTPASLIDQDPQKMLALLGLLKTLDMKKKYPNTTPGNIGGVLLRSQLEGLVNMHHKKFLSIIKKYGNDLQQGIVSNLDKYTKQLAKSIAAGGSTGGKIESASSFSFRAKWIAVIVTLIVIIILNKEIRKTICSLNPWCHERDPDPGDPEIQSKLRKKLGLLSEDLDDIEINNEKYDIEFDDVSLSFDHISKKFLKKNYDLGPIYIYLDDKNTSVESKKAGKELEGNDKLQTLIDGIANGRIPDALHDVLMEKRKKAVEWLVDSGFFGGKVKDINFTKEMNNSTFTFMYGEDVIGSTVEHLDPAKHPKDQGIIDEFGKMTTKAKDFVNGVNNEPQDSTQDMTPADTTKPVIQVKTN